VTEQPAFWIVAGINGAGKSTATKSGLYGTCLNPDASAKKIERVVRWPLLANYAAVVYLERVVASSIAIEKSVSVETVLSTQKYLRHVRRAKELGFTVGMAYIALASVELSIERVRERVLAGGHDVPEDKIRERWPRTLDNLAVFAPLLDELHVYDNSDGPPSPPTLIAYKTSGVVVMLHPSRLPEVTKRLT
jgi:predicted ABC-type ATPase